MNARTEAADTLATLLAERHDGDDVILFARASTGLYTLFRALHRERGPGEVIIPTLCCETVALAALFAGLQPVFVDVDPGSTTMSLELTTPHLSTRTQAVVLVHAFGLPILDAAAIASAASAVGAVVIEDLAQAVGGAHVGGHGDFTLLSFAEGKILRGEGGALIAHRTDLARALASPLNAARLELPAPPPPHRLALRTASLRNLCHGLYDAARASDLEEAPSPLARAGASLFHTVAPAYRDVIVRAGTLTDPALALEDVLRIPAIRVRRARRLERYADALTGTRLPLRLMTAPDAMYWRAVLVFDVPRVCALLTRALRRAGIPASNHYFPLDVLCGDAENPVGRRYVNGLLNLWVDDTIDDATVDRTIQLIHEFDADVEEAR
jgi:dTDP-4-amino-4,6-dideoxygalactose transaminase